MSFSSRNPDLVVLLDRPIGFTVKIPRMGGATAYRHPETLTECYYCPKCVGWVIGEPIQKSINGTRRQVRIGHTDSCLRCGQEIAFRGRMFP